MLSYKGYTGYVEFDDVAEIFHGEVIDISDVVTFQGKTPTEIKQAFIDSIDDYLEFCEQRGETPERPFSGKLTLRLKPELHKLACIAAKASGKSLNAWICESIIGHQLMASVGIINANKTKQLKSIKRKAAGNIQAAKKAKTHSYKSRG